MPATDPVPTPVPADLVLRNGVVRVLDAAGTRAEAVAVSGNRIVAVGSDAEVSRWIGPPTRVVELDGRAVLPGINDSHLHAAWLGARWPHTFFGGGSEGAPAPGALVSTRAERRAAILRAGRLLIEAGITSYTEPGLGPGEDAGETGCFHSEVLDVYRELAAEGALLQRVTALALYGVLDGPSDVATVLAGIRSHVAAPPESHPEWLQVPGIKIFGDLIPLSRQAWTSRPYDDGTHGDLLVEGETLERKAADLAAMIRAAHAAGLQVGVHATGDRTIQLAIDTIADAAAEPGARTAAELAHTIIHGDLATAAQIAELRAQGMWLNAQSGIAAHTSDWLAGVMGADTAADAWRYSDALDAGVLVLSSDAPVLGFDWRRGIADAEARIVASGGSSDAAACATRMLGLLRAYTALPAAQDRADAWKGTVEVGKVADLVVLELDPFAVGAAELPGVEIDATVLDGRVVYERAGAAPDRTGHPELA
ncbi:amidohydrolase family protein [Leucobacter rhizosphaerae]|uniref:Amidohydrolase family protein n=1 Tax=Leucobacter rhizosphaerae TaxID=2932245 RepID=A0ABY4FY86_9MICO|nr:amidohydrolase family protein [Leucobacter rhizosphaerae]UOQ61258.1 amidohydrolase family protein [Leucobacter rhizosphaerae]